MDRTQVWAIVEGAHRDSPFYDGILRSLADSRGHVIVRADQVEIDGVTAGGKAHVLRAATELASAGTLRQENSSGRSVAVFFVDRDDDDAQRAAPDNPHVITTEYSDVEAEIVFRADRQRAIAAAYSIASDESWGASVDSALRELGDRWRWWIEVRIAAGLCRATSSRFAALPKTTGGKYGDLDTASLGKLCCELEERQPTWPESLAAAVAHVDVCSKAGQMTHLLKGKWLPGSIDAVLRSAYGEHLPRVSDAHLLSTLLATIDFSAAWAEHFRAPLRRLLEDGAGSVPVAPLKPPRTSRDQP